MQEELFGLDLLSELARHLSLRDVEHLACTCHASAAHGELLYQTVALNWWGARFWKDARARRTLHAFQSMHQELFHMYRFEKLLRLVGDPPWTESQYRAWWVMEEMQFQMRERKKRA